MAIALVSNVEKTAFGTSGNISTVGANLIALVIGTTGGEPVPTDSASNTWQLYARTANNSGRAFLFLVTNPTTDAAHNFTVPNVGAPSFCVAAFSGIGDWFYKIRTANSAGTSTSVQPGSVTPPVNDCLVLGGFAYRDTTTVSIDGGFTITGQNPFNAGVAVGSALAYLVQTSAAASNPTWSWTNSATGSALQFVVAPPAPLTGGGYTSGSAAAVYPFGG